MKQVARASFHKRLAKGQGGNFFVYLAGACILWFAFFTIADWIKATKNTRVENEKKAHMHDDHVYPGDIYHNPYNK